MKTLETNELSKSKDYNELIHKIHDADIHLSSLMMDHMGPTKLTHKEFRTFALEEFIKLQRIIMGLGWLEHTGDWDPTIIIKLTHGDYWESPTGYSEMDIEGRNLIIYAPDELEEEDETKYLTKRGDNWIYLIPIQDIDTIELQR